MREVINPAPAQLPSPKLIAAARLLVGLTQRQLAEEAEVGRGSLARYEAGLATVRSDTLEAIIGALRRRGVKFLPPTRDYEMGLVLVRAES